MTARPRWEDLRADLAALHRAALAAADPAAAVARALRIDGEGLDTPGHVMPLAPSARVWLVAFGKASPGMARAAVDALGARLAGGVLAHPRAGDPGADLPASVRRFATGHPLPDTASLAAGEAALGMLRRVPPGDLVLVLVSGGGSALFEALLPGVTLEQLRAVTDALMRCGADIVELNTVRRALSRIKGGGLARACGPARLVTLVLSDVVGDRLDSIASGPTIESPPATGEAQAVLERHGLATGFGETMAALERVSGLRPADATAAERVVAIVGSNRLAAGALCAEAGRRGFTTLLLTDRLQGEAREVGRLVGGMARGVRESGLPVAAPACLVLGGETTVTVRGAGRGGRNLELALGAAHALEGCEGVAVFAFATDGLDGSSGAAGALATGETLARAAALGLSPGRALAGNDSEPFFRALGDLWITGASGTNVNDLAVALAY